MSFLKHVNTVVYLYTVVALSQETFGDIRPHADDSGRSLVRKKRMGAGDLVDRCWSEVDDTLGNAGIIVQSCIYRTQDDYLCYKILQSSGDYDDDDQECRRYDYERADVNSVLLLDGVAKLAETSESDSEFASRNGVYWMRVNSPLQDIQTGTCSEYNGGFTLNDNECTFLEIGNEGYKVKKKMCKDVRDDEGFICQARIEPTETPTKPPLPDIVTKIGRPPSDGGITSNRVQMTSEAAMQQQQPEETSSMPDAVVPISIALAVAVVCIVILVVFILCRRRTSNDDVGTRQKHDQPKPEVDKQQNTETNNTDSATNQYSSYGASLPGDYADIRPPKENPDFISVENELYNGGQYEYPMLPVSDKQENATELNDGYDSLGPHYHVLNREEEKEKKTDSYIEITNGTEDQEYSYPYVDFKK